jgi:Tfp pilus assembly protein PilO
MKQKNGIQAFFMVAGLAFSTVLQAQGIYRCGNSYSQVPCPGAESLQLNDSRQPEQKQQTEAAASQAARLAKTMEQARIAEEKRLFAEHRSLPSSPPGKPTTATVSTGSSTTTLTPKRVQPKHKKPDAFIAEVPGSEKPVVKKKPTPQPG